MQLYFRKIFMVFVFKTDTNRKERLTWQVSEITMACAKIPKHTLLARP